MWGLVAVEVELGLGSCGGQSTEVGVSKSVAEKPSWQAKWPDSWLVEKEVVIANAGWRSSSRSQLDLDPRANTVR